MMMEDLRHIRSNCTLERLRAAYADSWRRESGDQFASLDLKLRRFLHKHASPAKLSFWWMCLSEGALRAGLSNRAFELILRFDVGAAQPISSRFQFAGFRLVKIALGTLATT
jgi:hypothetical protein